MAMACDALRRLVALVLACAMAAPVATFRRGSVQVEDLNGDGRPDVWRFSDASSATVTVEADTDFDGRPDRQDTYIRGSLVRRELDRNGDGRFDLVETFNPDTREQTRSVVDVDFDGTADLLVLYRDGSPVFTSWRNGDARAADDSGRRSAWMVDPFRARAAVDAGADPEQDQTVARIASPAVSHDSRDVSVDRPHAQLLLPFPRPPVCDARSLPSPRGPPAGLLA
jgi:hypothetical protein